MEGKKEDERKCFSFTWLLENASYCFQKEGEEIKSPSFRIQWVEPSDWRLSLYPRGFEDGSNIGVFLYREDDDTSIFKITDFEISLLAVDGTTLTFSKSEQNFYSQQSIGFPNFARRKQIFNEEKSNFLPNDTLRIRCRIWSVLGNIKENVECYARTRIAVEWRSLVSTFTEFSHLTTNEKQTLPINSSSNDEQLAVVNMLLTENSSYEKLLHFEFECHNEKAKFSSIQFIILDAAGNAIERIKEEFCAISTGIELNKIEKLYMGRRGDSQRNPVDSYCMEDEERLSVSTKILKDNMKLLYSDGLLSDVKLKTKTATFPAHRNILSVRSSVFKAMFSSDMREKHGDSVDIEDISDYTLKRMLEYLYTADVEGLQWESAIDLYKAADKYEILSLKKQCSSFLKFSLTPTKACEILLLSDMYQDDDLKTYVQNYILKCDKDIFNSKDWNRIIESNPKLAAYTMRLKFI
ncbi:speckle-type POZ protein [Caerostris extrusa]|uniref:Speckle-type POZ protein n=1 Tax=Caerostris extrusa TaxID=172846 RepID=A0AAV4VFW6_CAEEX|nr:speckle-type POZ protein [Caerostris extrusa]